MLHCVFEEIGFKMKRSSSFASPRSHPDPDVIEHILKTHCPLHVWQDGAAGQPLFHARADLQDECLELMKKSVSADPYMKKTDLAQALLDIDAEGNFQLSKSDGPKNRNDWSRQEAFAIKACMISALRAFHNMKSGTKLDLGLKEIVIALGSSAADKGRKPPVPAMRFAQKQKTQPKGSEFGSETKPDALQS